MTSVPLTLSGDEWSAGVAGGRSKGSAAQEAAVGVGEGTPRAGEGTPGAGKGIPGTGEGTTAARR